MTDREEAMSTVFTPELVLPEQCVNRDALSGERRLMLAILEEAVGTFQRYFEDPTRRGRRLFEEAREWIDSDDTSRMLAFLPICDLVGIDPDYLRQGLDNWSATRRGLARKTRRASYRRTNERRVSIERPTLHLRKIA